MRACANTHTHAHTHASIDFHGLWHPNLIDRNHSACAWGRRCVYAVRARARVFYLSSSPPLGPWSICSPAPSPAPSSQLCTDSPLCVSGGGKPGSPPWGSPGRPQLHDPPASPSPPQRSGQVTPVCTCWLVVVFWGCCFCWVFSLNCPSPASVRCPVPWTQRSRQCGTARAWAAESSTFPCWIRSDMCLLFLPPSLFSQDARLCACLCQRAACVKCRCVRSRSLPPSLSLSFWRARARGWFQAHISVFPSGATESRRWWWEDAVGRLWNQLQPAFTLPVISKNKTLKKNL